MGVGDFQRRDLLPAAELAQHVADQDRRSARRACREFEGRHAAGGPHLKLDVLVVEFAVAQLPPEGLAGRCDGAGPTSASTRALRRSSARGLGRPCAAFPGRGDADFDEVADDLFDVAADIADLGEFRRFDLEERGAEPGSRREISVLPTPVGPIIGMFFGSTSRAVVSSCWRRQRLRKGDGDRALGVGLADDVAVELGDDLAGEKLVMVVVPGPGCHGSSEALGHPTCPAPAACESRLFVWALMARALDGIRTREHARRARPAASDRRKRG